MNPVLHRGDVYVRGLRLSYLERGAGSAGPSVVLLHGLVGEAEVFRKLIAALPAEWHLVALDLPGAGYSERPLSADVSFSGMAGAVRDAIAVLGLEQPVLLGHSHGGAVALQFGAEYPEDLSALILLCPATPFSRKDEKLARFYLSAPGRRFATLLPRLPRWLHLFAFRRMPGSRGTLGYNDIEPYVHTLREAGTVRHLLRLLESWSADKRLLGRQLGTRPLGLPVLMLWGDKDVVVPRQEADRLARHLSKSQLHVLPGVGHLPNEEAPLDCARFITTWLREVATQSFLPRD